MDDRRALEARALEAEVLLSEIASYCRETKVAETTFGRLAVNDGKFVSRLRNGSRVTTDTVRRVRSFMGSHNSDRLAEPGSLPVVAEPTIRPAVSGDTGRNFRFFDNRQKYLLFVTT